MFFVSGRATLPPAVASTRTRRGESACLRRWPLDQPNRIVSDSGLRAESRFVLAVNYCGPSALAIRLRRLIFCLGDTAFTNPPIGQTLAANGRKQLVVALGVADLERSAAVIAEVKFRQVAKPMGFSKYW